MEIIKELKARWKAESPIFWKKVLMYAEMVGVPAASILLADPLFSLSTYLPSIIFTVCGYIVTFCIAVGLSAKITKQ